MRLDVVLVFGTRIVGVGIGFEMQCVDRLLVRSGKQGRAIGCCREIRESQLIVEIRVKLFFGDFSLAELFVGLYKQWFVKL